jgi:glyoxylase I family protein
MTPTPASALTPCGQSELDAWQAHFERLGVTHTPTVDREYGSVLTFKDPDGIQGEMFYRRGHP